MSTKIGWMRERPSASGRRVGIFQYMKIVNDRGRQFVVGYLWYTADDLNLLRKEGKRLDLRVVGALRFTNDVTPALVDETIDIVNVSGPIFASDEVKRALHATAHRGNGSSKETST